MKEVGWGGGWKGVLIRLCFGCCGGRPGWPLDGLRGLYGFRFVEVFTEVSDDLKRIRDRVNFPWALAPVAPSVTQWEAERWRE